MLILNTSTARKRYLVAYTVRGFATLANDAKFSLGSILGLKKASSMDHMVEETVRLE